MVPLLERISVRRTSLDRYGQSGWHAGPPGSWPAKAIDRREFHKKMSKPENLVKHGFCCIDRDPRKRAKDAQQAGIVQALLKQHVIDASFA
jgi:hypothetical protein